jgi:hypothetical protein
LVVDVDKHSLALPSRKHVFWFTIVNSAKPMYLGATVGTGKLITGL